MKEVCSSKTSVNLYLATWHNFPENNNLHNEPHDNLKSWLVFYCLTICHWLLGRWIIMNALKGPSLLLLPSYLNFCLYDLLKKLYKGIRWVFIVLEVCDHYCPADGLLQQRGGPFKDKRSRMLWNCSRHSCEGVNGQIAQVNAIAWTCKSRLSLMRLQGFCWKRQNLHDLYQTV